jgi:glutamine amidotransferase
MVHPIIDEYYNPNPYHTRSTGLVISKGLDIGSKSQTEKPPSGLSTPAPLAEGWKSKPDANPFFEGMAGKSTPNDTLPMATLPDSYGHKDAVRPIDIRVAEPVNVSIGDTTRPQEIGNTKKKRRSLTLAPTDTRSELPELSAPSLPRESPELRASSSYGDPAKLAQFFPELTLGS